MVFLALKKTFFMQLGHLVQQDIWLFIKKLLTQAIQVSNGQFV